MKTVWLWRIVLNAIDVNGIAKCTPTSFREPRKQSPRQNAEIEVGISDRHTLLEHGQGKEFGKQQLQCGRA